MFCGVPPNQTEKQRNDVQNGRVQNPLRSPRSRFNFPKMGALKILHA